jgi:hypothetical protein
MVIPFNPNVVLDRHSSGVDEDDVLDRWRLPIERVLETVVARLRSGRRYLDHDHRVVDVGPVSDQAAAMAPSASERSGTATAAPRA